MVNSKPSRNECATVLLFVPLWVTVKCSLAPFAEKGISIISICSTLLGRIKAANMHGNNSRICPLPIIIIALWFLHYNNKIKN